MESGLTALHANGSVDVPAPCSSTQSGNFKVPFPKSSNNPKPKGPPLSVTMYDAGGQRITIVPGGARCDPFSTDTLFFLEPMEARFRDASTVNPAAPSAHETKPTARPSQEVLGKRLPLGEAPAEDSNHSGKRRKMDSVIANGPQMGLYQLNSAVQQAQPMQPHYMPHHPYVRMPVDRIQWMLRMEEERLQLFHRLPLRADNTPPKEMSEEDKEWVQSLIRSSTQKINELKTQLLLEQLMKEQAQQQGQSSSALFSAPGPSGLSLQPPQ